MFVCFYIVMTYEYFSFVAPLFTANNFVLSFSPTTINVGFVMLFVLMLRLFINKKVSEFSYAISVFVSITFAIPAIILYQFGNCTIYAPLYSILFVFALTLEASGYVSLSSTFAILTVCITATIQEYVLYEYLE